MAWIDDDYWDVSNPEISVEEYYKDEFKSFFNKYDLEVVLFAYDWDTFDKARKLSNVPLDAVIFDLNFSSSGLPDGSCPEHESDFSGFLYALGFINEQSSSPNPIQAYVYTGRDKILRDQALKNRPKNLPESHIFQKGDIDRLCKKMKEDLDEENRPDMRIRRRFTQELENARTVSSKCEEYLLESLLFAFNNTGVASSIEIEQKIQLLRDICEKCLLVKCAEKSILPPLESINEAASLILYKNVTTRNGKTYKLNGKVEVMNPAICYMFCKTVNTMTNDVKHTKDGLRIQIRDHIQQSNDLNIYRGMLFMTISVLQWYCDNAEKLVGGKCWYTDCSPRLDNKTDKKDGSVGYAGGTDLAIDKIDDRNVYSGRVKIKKKLNVQYRLGMIVHIEIESVKNNILNDKEDYPFFVNYDQHSIKE